MNYRSLMSLSSLAIVGVVSLSSLSSTTIAGQQRQGAPALPAATSARGGQAATPALPAAVIPKPTLPTAAPAAPAKPYIVKKTPDGQPDLQGYWTNATYTPLERGNNAKEFFTEAEYAASVKQRAAMDEEQTTPGTPGDVHYDFTQFGLDTSQSPVAVNLRTSLIIDPPNGKLPARVGATGGAAAGAGARGGARGGGGAGGGGQYDSIQNMAAGTRCIIMGGSGPPMMDAGYNAAYQIVQSPGYVTILTEMIHDARVIPLGSRPLPPAQLKQWVGLSRGHWEGNTLVVETTNFNGRNVPQRASANVRVTERFTRVAEDKIDYKYTVTDESTWVSPWTAEVPLTKEKGPIFEFACHETNYGPANILSGARAAEREAAAKK